MNILSVANNKISQRRQSSELSYKYSIYENENTLTIECKPSARRTSALNMRTALTARWRMALGNWPWWWSTFLPSYKDVFPIPNCAECTSFACAKPTRALDATIRMATNIDHAGHTFGRFYTRLDNEANRLLLCSRLAILFECWKAERWKPSPVLHSVWIGLAAVPACLPVHLSVASV